ncbi:hypothetical protein NEUTE2DRAFT_51997 [Neurospora tetrasperma FGSC 2509]|nr:hypothetical protein NEUTE2DRAFT_51997 [Neurospora tetrasperma FGSC 2509]
MLFFSDLIWPTTKRPGAVAKKPMSVELTQIDGGRVAKPISAAKYAAKIKPNCSAVQFQK